MKICVICSKSFEQSLKSSRKTCSRSCQAFLIQKNLKIKSEENPTLLKNCLICSKNFSPKVRTQLYCHKTIKAECDSCSAHFNYNCNPKEGRFYPKIFCSNTCVKKFTQNKRIKNITISKSILVQEWDYEKNDVSPENISVKSSKYIFWLCEKHKHSWSSPPSRRNPNKLGDCSVCSNRKLLIGYNDFATRYPILAKEWSSNNKIKPSDFLVKGDTKFLWNCPKGHEYLATTKHRIRGHGCSICINREIIPGINDLETLFPALMKEWDWIKNKIKPNNVSAFNFMTVWWKCESGHSWNTSIINRTVRKTGCRYCSRNYSLEEKEFSDFIESIYTGKVLRQDRKILSGKELDVFLPEISLALEYNGIHWHDKNGFLKDLEKGTSETNEMKKTLLCEKLGITLIHIWSDEWKKNTTREKEKLKNIITELHVKSKENE